MYNIWITLDCYLNCIVFFGILAFLAFTSSVDVGWCCWRMRCCKYPNIEFNLLLFLSNTNHVESMEQKAFIMGDLDFDTYSIIQMAANSRDDEQVGNFEIKIQRTRNWSFLHCFVQLLPNSSFLFFRFIDPLFSTQLKISYKNIQFFFFFALNQRKC